MTVETLSAFLNASDVTGCYGIEWRGVLSVAMMYY